MRLSDIVGYADLSRYAEIALLLFFAAFIAIVIAIFRPSRRAELERASQLPLDDTARTTEERRTP